MELNTQEFDFLNKQLIELSTENLSLKRKLEEAEGKYLALNTEYVKLQVVSVSLKQHIKALEAQLDEQRYDNMWMRQFIRLSAPKVMELFQRKGLPISTLTVLYTFLSYATPDDALPEERKLIADLSQYSFNTETQQTTIKVDQVGVMVGKDLNINSNNPETDTTP